MSCLRCLDRLPVAPTVVGLVAVVLMVGCPGGRLEPGDDDAADDDDSTGDDDSVGDDDSTDDDSTPDWTPSAEDLDGDGLPNEFEMKIGTEPEQFDTDGDGIGDARST